MSAGDARRIVLVAATAFAAAERQAQGRRGEHGQKSAGHVFILMLAGRGRTITAVALLSYPMTLSGRAPLRQSGHPRRGTKNPVEAKRNNGAEGRKMFLGSRGLAPTLA